ncbi:MAG: MFS transporter [Anaerolineae bacterium]
MGKLRDSMEKWRRSLRDFWSRARYRLGESGWARGPSLRDLRPSGLERHAREAEGRLRVAEERLRLQGERLQASLKGALPWKQARTEAERNIWYLYIEVFWAGIFLAALAFNATYALRLGGTNTQIGWLSSIPSLLAMVVLVPAARFLETKSDRAPWLYWSLIVGRALFIGAALAPWVLPRYAAQAVVAVLILRSLPMHFYSAGFSPMLADVIPPRDRALVLANRSIISSATVAVCTYLFGQWMDAATRIPWAGFPLNYQLVYIVGAVAGVLSGYFVSRIEPPATAVIERQRSEFRAARLSEIRESFRTLVQHNRSFVRIVINTFVFSFGAWLVGPLYMIFFIRQLNASDGWVGLNTTMAHIGVISGNLLWRRIIDRRGLSWSLRVAVPLAASYAFLVSFFPNLNLILLFGVLINLVNPGVNLSHGSMLYSLTPKERRASYMALYATISNIGAFVAPMIGVALSKTIDIRWILLAGGIIRLIGAGMFHAFRIELPEAEVAE